MSTATTPIATTTDAGDPRMPIALRFAMAEGRLSHNHLLQSGTGALLGPAMPRLPRPPLLGLDEVTDLQTCGGAHGLGGASGRMALHRLDWAFACHFQDDPLLPGNLMLEALMQLVGLTAIARGYVGRARAMAVRDVRFLAEVRSGPGHITYRVDLRRASDARQVVLAQGEASVNGRPCARADGLVLAVLPEVRP